MNKRIALSITVHESPKCVVDKIHNTLKYLHNTFIVLHISSSFHCDPLWFKNMRNVYVNPNRLDTLWCHIAHCHVSNFNYLEQQRIPFDVFALDASNSLLIKPNLNKIINQYSIGCSLNRYTYPDVPNGREELPKDESLRKIMVLNNWTDIYQGHHEGTFYQKAHFQHIVNVLQPYVYDKTNIYAREETLFSTIAYNSFPQLLTDRTEPFIRLYFDNDQHIVTQQLVDETLSIPKWYGIKRVPRNYDDPIRQYIRNLP